MFKAILLSKTDAGFDCRLTELDDAQLPEGDVTVRIDYSTINFKDGLALTNRSPIVRTWPMVPGIDLAGSVESSSHPDWKAGDKVVLNSWGVGEGHWGGLAQKARVRGDWLVPLPAAFTTRQAMAIGTAGYTAMLCVISLEEHHVTPDKGDILVTGASGGVGASTGRLAEADYLKSLGAAEVIDRAELSQPGKPLQKERWAGVVDAVGSHTLANACAQTKGEGTVTACGLAAGMDFPSTVAPFILRGVTLRGVNCVTRPQAERMVAWRRLASGLDAAKLDAMTSETSLAGAIQAAPEILAGKIRGRLVVDVNT